jgi:transposase
MVNGSGFQPARVVVGVDTHKDEHVAVAIDLLGARLGEHRVGATTQGATDLDRWSRGLGEVTAFGIEGTGCYGAGLSRFLTSHGHAVIEVNRPDRSTRRQKGRSDPTDAEMAARSVLAGVARITPKSGDGNVEMLRMLKITKDSAIKARTQAMNQMQAIIVTAPAALRETLRELTEAKLVDRCARLRPGKLSTPTSAAKHALRILALRCRHLTGEANALEKEMAQLTEQTAPALLQVFGVGPNCATTLLITAGSNPDRFRSEAAFAALCGVSPLPASSGRTDRHRLNRGGDRQANAALYRIVLVRLQYDPKTQAYMKRRTREGMTKAEIIRCLKRYVAREVFGILRELERESAVKGS